MLLLFYIMGGVGVNMLDTYQEAGANIYLIEQIFACLLFKYNYLLQDLIPC